MLARDDQLSQAVEVTRQQLTCTKTLAGYASNGRTSNWRIPLNGSQIRTVCRFSQRFVWTMVFLLESGAGRIDLNIIQSQFLRIIHGSVVVIIKTIAERLIEVHPQTFEKIHRKQLCYRSVAQIRIVPDRHTVCLAISLVVKPLNVT